jgi:hypothetical protein
VDFHGDWHKLIDAYVSPGLREGRLVEDLGNNWYQPYLDASVGVPVYFPDMNIGGQTFGRRLLLEPKPEGASNAKISAAARTI